MHQRIGIDVGGTNTDAVLMQGREVVGWVKTPTTADVTSGIVTALRELLQHTAAVPSAIRGVMIGTTGESRCLHGLDPAFVRRCVEEVGRMIADSVDRMKISAAPVQLIAVGGGSFLVPDILPGISQVRRAPHYQVANAAWLERMARAVTIQMGCHAAYAMAPWSGAEIKRTAVLHMVTQARRIGTVVLQARQRQENPIPALVASQGGYVLFQGKIVDVVRRVTGGFARGEVTIEGLDDYNGQHLTIDFQNENFIARCREAVLCTVPDLICILERDTATPINTALLRYGWRVVVVGFPAPEQLTSVQALQVVGPQALGYDVPYRPLAPSATGREQVCHRQGREQGT